MKKLTFEKNIFSPHYILYLPQVCQFLWESLHYTSSIIRKTLLTTCGHFALQGSCTAGRIHPSQALQLLEQILIKTRLGELETRSRCLEGVEWANGAWID